MSLNSKMKKIMFKCHCMPNIQSYILPKPPFTIDFTVPEI